jgi:hypothetical protein
MNSINLEKILRNLEKGCFITHQEQDETAKYIRQQEESIKALHKNLHDYVADIVRMRSRGRAALAALQTGSELDVGAAIEILKGI